LAMHHATFQLTDEAIDQPVRDLRAALGRHGAGSFLTPEVGETWQPPRQG
ncbi:MAG: MBL fold metallo-hydrolase, partial [Deltaproteobacteria bacterium]|nr:MBL fold metallo-hydrolase [Deltaproteobacteria bacterium]